MVSRKVRRTMKPNKKEIAEKLAEWARLQNKRLAIEAKRDKDLDPHITRFERATAEINAKAQLKLDALNQDIAPLAKEIEQALLAGVNHTTGVIALAQVSLEGGEALAEVKAKEGPRVVDPEIYLEKTPPAKRTAGFWAGLKVVIAPAEAFMGKLGLNALAKKPTTYSVELKLVD